MISIEKRETRTCCGKKRMNWILSVPLQISHLDILAVNGFSFLSSFLDAGMLYVEDKGLIASGVFGQKDLQIKCKNKNCESSSELLENIIKANF